MNPTEEQAAAVAYFRLGMVTRVEAGAGTGKTSTLKLMAGATQRTGRYVAFNKAIVVDSAKSMPDNVACSTAHSLAFQAVGKKYRDRLDSGRMRSMDVARTLGIDHITLEYGSAKKVLQPGYLASLVQRTITTFCFTADPEPTEKHVPYIDGIDVPDIDGFRTWTNNNIVRAHIKQAVDRAWQDAQQVNGRLPFKHDFYLKLWQLSNPTIPGDFILFDEAQDAAPVMLAAVTGQDAQLVLVGDSQQQIYEWRGAVNALGSIDADATAYLTQSWRFGPAIARTANLVLAELNAELRLTGCAVPSVVAPIDGAPDAVLARSNACAVETVLRYQQEGRAVHLVGGGADVLRFAQAVDELRSTGRTWHPDLACFESWGEVIDYVDQDPQGGELKLLTELVEEFSTDVIIRALQDMPRESASEIIVSTAHKAKGREWDRVRLAGDFQDPDDGADGEWRLLYVAATRARLHLDAVQCAPLMGLLEPEGQAVPLPL